MSNKTTKTKETTTTTVERVAVTAIMLSKRVEYGLIDKHSCYLFVKNEDVKASKIAGVTSFAFTDSRLRELKNLEELLGNKAPTRKDYTLVRANGKEITSGKIGEEIEIYLGVDNNNYLFGFTVAGQDLQKTQEEHLISSGFSEEDAKSIIANEKSNKRYREYVSQLTTKNKGKVVLEELDGIKRPLDIILSLAEWTKNNTPRRSYVNKVAVPVKDMSKMDEIFDK